MASPPPKDIYPPLSGLPNTLSFEVTCKRPHGDNPPGIYTLQFSAHNVVERFGKKIIIGHPFDSNAVKSIVTREGECAEYDTGRLLLTVPFKEELKHDQDGGRNWISIDAWDFKVSSVVGL